MMAVSAPVPIASTEYAAALDFLYREARLLDGSDHVGWLELLHPEIEYRMPVRVTCMPKDGSGFVDEMEFFSENFSSLNTRVRRLQTEQAWAEQPGSRTRHIVANTLVERAGNGDLEATSSFIVTRTRADMPYDLFTGERRDRLRREDGQLLLVGRMIYFDQTVLQAMNLSIFF